MIQSIKKAIITNFIRLGRYAVQSIGGTSNAHFVSPKGLYSRPTRDNGLLFQVLKDEGNKIVIPLQKATNLSPGDVILLDDSGSHIHFKFSSQTIEIKGNILEIGNVVHIGDLNNTGNITTSGKMSCQTTNVSGLDGVSGTFTTADAKTVTVTNGIITSIV